MNSFLSSLKNLVFIDIETVSAESDFTLLSERMQAAWLHKALLLAPERKAEELYFDKAAIYAEFGKVIVIGVGFFFVDENDELGFKVKAFSDHQEQKILADFSALLEQKYQSRNVIFCAHNGKEFDYPYLCRRYLVNGLPLPKPLQLMGKKPWEVAHLDTLEMWKFGDRKNYTPLELLAAMFDVPGSKSEMNGSMVNKAYYRQDKMADIARYCMEDVVVTAQLYLRMHGENALKAQNIIRLGVQESVCQGS